MKLFTLNIRNKTLTFIFVALLVWWVSIFLRHKSDTLENYLYSLTYGLIPLIWGIFGLRISRLWGGFKSVMGKSISFLSLGMVVWGVANLIYNGYYNIVVNIPVPYPSIADYIYVLCFPAWIIGIIYLSKASGMFLSLRKLKGKLLLLIIPLCAIAVSFYLLFIVARGGALDTAGGIEKLIFDIAFPVGDVLILTFSLILYGLSFDYLGGHYKLPIIITLIGFGLAYITDFSYSYTTTVGTFFVANWVDLLYTVTFFFLAIGITSLDPRLSSYKENS
jgi:hypothetical protein